MHAEMADADRPSIRRLQLDEGVLADLDIDQLNLPFRIVLPECFGESQRLGIIRNRLVEIGYVDPDVIQRNDPFVWAQTRILREGSVDGQSTNQSAGYEQSKTAHDNLPCFEIRRSDHNTVGSAKPPGRLAGEAAR